jgi:hypothetical protein
MLRLELHDNLAGEQTHSTYGIEDLERIKLKVEKSQKFSALPEQTGRRMLAGPGNRSHWLPDRPGPGA